MDDSKVTDRCRCAVGTCRTSPVIIVAKDAPFGPVRLVLCDSHRRVYRALGYLPEQPPDSPGGRS